MASPEVPLSGLIGPHISPGSPIPFSLDLQMELSVELSQPVVRDRVSLQHCPVFRFAAIPFPTTCSSACRRFGTSLNTRITGKVCMILSLPPPPARPEYGAERNLTRDTERQRAVWHTGEPLTTPVSGLLIPLNP